MPRGTEEGYEKLLYIHVMYHGGDKVFLKFLFEDYRYYRPLVWWRAAQPDPRFSRRAHGSARNEEQEDMKGGVMLSPEG